MSVFFFFFNDTATTEIYTLSLHDALPICVLPGLDDRRGGGSRGRLPRHRPHPLPARQGRAQEASEGRTRMTERNDHDLGEQFHVLRREDAAAAPPFHATLAAARARRAPPPGRRTRWLAAAAAAVAGVAPALLFTP